MDEEQRLKREVGEGGKEKKERKRKKEEEKSWRKKRGKRQERKKVKSPPKREGADPCELRLEVGIGSLPRVGVGIGQGLCWSSCNLLLSTKLKIGQFLLCLCP